MTDAQPPAPPAGPPKPERPPGRRGLWIAVLAMPIVFGVAFWLVIAKLPELLNDPRGGPSPDAVETASPAPAARRIVATLFYVSDTGLELVPASREIPYGATAAEQARRIVEAQLQTPAGRVSAIPAGTTVRTVFLAESGEAFVDLGPEILDLHSGGSLNEALAVFAIVNALTTNLADITAVQILVEGRQVDTLAGHVDLRHPLPQALDWVRKGK